LYAYSTHADVPNFPLNPRIFVQIIPYQFQTVAFGPAFIKRWSAKVKRFGLYDYFKYPDASWDMPGGYTLDQLMARAMNAAEAGSEGTTYESSYSKFSTAIPLWVLIQYMCTGDANWKKNYDQLITDLYGGASSSIKNLFDVFYFQPQFGTAELGKSLNDINEAQNQTKDPQVLARINELSLYLTYASTYLKSQDLDNGDLEQRMLPVEKIAWTVYQKKIIHSYRIMQLVSYGFLNAKTNDKNVSQRNKKLHVLTFPESKDPDAYWKVSAIRTIKNAHTPTFLFAGERDVEVPPTQSVEYWHALKAMNVPVSLVIYPDEGHGIREPEHVLDYRKRIVGWFDRYLGKPAQH